jgi:hypothetical protein
MKYEWRKNDKSLYLPKTKPEITNVESYTYISISGNGNPGSDDFTKDIEALYATAYTIKMAPKKGYEIDGYYDYVVFPLEGIWSLDDKGKEMYRSGTPIKELKDHFTYDLMIRQPEFLTRKWFDEFRELASQKKKNPHILNIEYFISEKKNVCQCMHLGSYDNEPETFKLMQEYTDDNGYLRESKIHTEIYLSDARKTEEGKLKTTLRFDVIKK